MIDSWTGLQLVVGKNFINVSWPEPPNSFLGASSVEQYLILVGEIPGKILVPRWVSTEERKLRYEWVLPVTNYTLTVIAVLKDGRRGSMNWKHFKTTEGGKRVCLS